MSYDLISPLWGARYGSKRHLVDMSTLHRGAWTQRCRSRCSTAAHPRYLDYLADEFVTRTVHGMFEAELVASRPPCARCLKIAQKEAS